jgi:uncharacterized MAPEG superfamily protein
MTIALWCILVVALMPYGTVAIAKWRRDFDNNHPRDWLGKLEGHRKRAHAAHLNHFESMPGFFAAVIVAQMVQAPRVWIDALAVAFVICRIIFTWAYIKDKATLRSVVWIVGLGCVVALFLLAGIAGKSA